MFESYDSCNLKILQVSFYASSAVEAVENALILSLACFIYSFIGSVVS